MRTNQLLVLHMDRSPITGNLRNETSQCVLKLSNWYQPCSNLGEIQSVPMPYVEGGRRTFTNTGNENQWFEVCEDAPTVAMATRSIQSGEFPE